MFTKLAMVILLASETPVEATKTWQSKVACEKQEGLNEAFISGFYDAMLGKTACENAAYILGSELGKELSINILYNMKHAEV